ncbi:MAG: hypothetical protein ACLPX1_09340 [Steroidobacteraceae bacterium]
MAVIALSACHKKPPPAAAVPPIDTSRPTTFGDASWLAERAAHEKNVTVSGGGSFAHVTYKPEVKLIDKAAIESSLQGISSDGHGAVFDHASAEILALKAGDIILVKDAFAAKVLAAETTGSQTVLIIDSVKLVELVQEGEINLEPSISFNGPKLSEIQPSASPAFGLLDWVIPPVDAQPPPTYSSPPLPAKSIPDQVSKSVQNAVIEGWKIDRWSVTPSDKSALVSTRITKDTNGFKAAIDVDGTITDFQFVSDIKIPMKNVQDTIAPGVQHMSGHFHFVWEMGKDTPGVWAAEDKFKLPAAIDIPLAPVLGGMPLTLEISAAFLIHPALTGGNEYSKSGFEIDWAGATSQAAQSGGAPGTVTFKITDHKSITAAAPTAMVISFCAPRIELKLAFLGNWASNIAVKLATEVIDATVRAVAQKLLPSSIYNFLAASPLGRMTATNILSSSADIYAQVINTEGITNAPNITLAPCTKTQLVILGQVGGDVQLLNLAGGKKSMDVFTKTYTVWDPGSDFCKSI